MQESRTGDVARVLAQTGDPGPADGPPVLVLLAGVPGSGKSTLARALAPRIPAALIESDAARLALVDRPRYTRGESARVFAAVHEAIEHLLESGRSVILDATSARARDRAPVLAIARETGARLVIVHLTAPEAVALERLGRRREARDRLDHSQAGEQVYRRMAAQFERITEPHLRVDTSEGIEAAVARVLRAVEGGSE